MELAIKFLIGILAFWAAIIFILGILVGHYFF